MKRRTKIILACVIVVALVLILFLTGIPGVASKSHAGILFKLNREKFELAATQVLEQSSTIGVTNPPGVKDIDFYRAHSGCVDFYMGGFGLVPSSTYWGIAYSVDGEPVGFQGLDVNYTWDGEGWYWQEKNSDNCSYVTKLDDHWYSYRMSF